MCDTMIYNGRFFCITVTKDNLVILSGNAQTASRDIIKSSCRYNDVYLDISSVNDDCGITYFVNGSSQGAGISEWWLE